MPARDLMMSKKKRAAIQKQAKLEEHRRQKEIQELCAPLFPGAKMRMTQSVYKAPKFRAADTSMYPSHETFGSSNATPKKDSQQYTGTKLKGIGIMHKSNMVPIFSDEEAISIAQMRRN